MFSQINLKDITSIAIKAGKSVLEIYNKDFKISYKDDNSPLSEADIISNKIICKELVRFNIPILSEENKTIPYKQRKNWEYFWCIDPIDGTKEFINKNGEFTINIALIYKDTPVLGVVYAPALDLLYSAKKGEGAFRNGVKLPLQRNDDFYKIVASKSHLNEQTKDFVDSIQTTKQKEFISMGSSLKLCLVASNEADIYPRLAPTMEWDVAAADAIVREVGKMTYDFYAKKPLVYNKENLLNPYFIVE
ncbi:3'(2'),5'-bisphosphate nucleotidase CysQ [Campylobacter lari]|uniref:3'(2'),5'-bisphosphate nucleotidase CysQ n=1 Tax=Campylobacter TaxID=194 RepID=UPI001288344C|nr:MULTISPECIES: 3'(2'),5'-bisphosphate nucleotidase CysQ [Campylobacter]EAK0818245.1 3'(2'),5'-bisphosphate nucleotidase CysQ [Campylobacter lari]EAK9890876.1 3'(2'),5'-bisphosphate nucleotidase CysQ [Campylobacter lari]EGK8025289.1 3'(2'),5'-bisphosphate nucleotidase CysQ [Campylobacter lari]EGK8129346.1 3'(2'),5'-bisphosphate nucleotidase CysQ [Campylobacter lari]MCR6776407.1 3'(2'),5'-bisphosphate nucleotidase CysQ [Campylobacter lari]